MQNHRTNLRSQKHLSKSTDWSKIKGLLTKSNNMDLLSNIYVDVLPENSGG